MKNVEAAISSRRGGGGVKSLSTGGVKKFGTGGLPVWGVLLLGVSTPLHAMQCDPGWKLKSPLAEFKRFFFGMGERRTYQGMSGNI